MPGTRTTVNHRITEKPDYYISNPKKTSSTEAQEDEDRTRTVAAIMESGPIRQSSTGNNLPGQYGSDNRQVSEEGPQYGNLTESATKS